MPRSLSLVLAGILGVAAFSMTSAGSEAPQCLQCHEDTNKKGALEQSVHNGLDCANCHSYISKNLTNHPENMKITQRADCYLCHSDIAKQHRESIHGISLNEGIDEAATCWSCHGSHDIQPVKDPKSKVHPAHLAATCGSCHDNAELMKKVNVAIPQPGRRYPNSVHGRLVQEGRADAPTCSGCHGVHDIKNKVQAGSRISTIHTPALCGQCHKKASDDFTQSIHWIRAKKGFRESPVCDDCHSEHSVTAVKTAEERAISRRIQEETCIICHENPRISERFGKDVTLARKYTDSYHGLAVMSGDVQAAMCVDCHGVHMILPKDHSDSTVNPEHVVSTCKKCHPNATPLFSNSYSHKTENATAKLVEHWVSVFYFWLILLTIGGMVSHNLLIFVHEFRAKLKRDDNTVTIPRFTKNEVIQHFLLFASFTGLAITGFALKYNQSLWAEILQFFGMNETARQYIHRGSAVVIMAIGVYHIFYMIFTPRGRDVLINLLPKLSDFRDLYDNVRYHVGFSAHKPKSDQYSYSEKAEYWALIWGTIIMGATGLILWFPTIVGDWAPVWLIKVSEIIHFYEAVLATLAILVWHLFFVMFHPHEYPMSLTWLDGQMSLASYRDHHERHFRRIVLEWKELELGRRSKNNLSNSTQLFLNAFRGKRFTAAEVLEAEIDRDPELKAWLEERLNRTTQ